MIKPGKNIEETTPSKWLINFFRWYCHPEYVEDLEGDLLERFQGKMQAKGRPQANLQLAKDVLRLFRPGIIRSFDSAKCLNHYPMFKNYFKISWRSLLKQKLYAFINIGGLAVGLTCFILIFLYVQHELSFDRFYSNADQIYRVYQKQVGNEYLGTDEYAVTTAELASALMDEFPEVRHATTVSESRALLTYEKNSFLEKGLWADDQIFNVLPQSALYGKLNGALKDPKTIVLTASTASKIFGDQNPIGKLLLFRNRNSFKATAVVNDPPSNASLQFAFIASIQSNGTYVREMEQFDWDNNDFHTFFTSNITNVDEVNRKFPDLIEKYIKKDQHFKPQYFAQPMTDFHLDINKNMDIGLKGNQKYVSLFTSVAIIVLLLACVNYMNLAIARSLQRATEVGLRKAIGAIKAQLITQFIGESIFISFIALLFALAFSYMLSPVFGQILDRPLELSFTQNPILIPGLLVLVIIVGIISGSYPAFMMSSLRPVQVLKGKLHAKVSGFNLQKVLLVGQFGVAILLITGSIVVYQQFQFIQNKELGYNKDHIVTIPILDRGLFKHFDVLKNNWANDPSIIGITSAAELPTNVTSGTLINHINKQDENRFDIYRARMNFDYLKVFDIQLIAGRDFSPAFASDTTESIILNETAVKAFGWTPQEAVGKYVKNHMNRKVIGVVKDFHMHSMHQEIKPLMLVMITDYFAHIAVKIRAGQVNKSLDVLRAGIDQFSDYPVDFVFLDEKFDQLYKADFKLGQIFGVFTILSIIIASLGLFGMAAFMAKQRTKEVGIRKVLGATVSHIMSIFLQDFLRLVALAFIIAVPIAWWATQLWLNDFVYRISLSWWMFLVAGGLAMLLAIFTVSAQSLKAALGNPVIALKNE